MAITATHLTTNGDAVDNTVFTTASISPSSNRLVLIVVQSALAAFTGPVDPTITGNGLTWVQVGSRIAEGTDVHHLHVYRAMGASPTTGAVTITWSDNREYCWWSIAEFDGVDTSGTNGSGAVVQTTSNTGSGTSLTVTLAAFGSVNNATYGGFGSPNFRTFTAGSGFTLFGQAGTAGEGCITSERQLANDTSVDITVSSSASLLGRAIEIKAAAAGTDATASPSAIAVPVTLPSPSLTGHVNKDVSPVAVTTALPSAVVTGGGTATPSAIAVPVTLPVPAVTAGGSASTTPSPITVAVTLPSPTPSSGETVAAPAAIEVSATLPSPDLTGHVNLIPDPITVPIEIPEPNAFGNIDVEVLPAPITVAVSLPALTARQLRQFTPPSRLEVPPTLPSSRGPARSLFRHYRARVAGRNVFYMNNGTVTENDPVTTYNPDGTINEEAWDRVEEVFWGGHDAQRASDAAATALEAAGYTVDTDALVS